MNDVVATCFVLSMHYLLSSWTVHSTNLFSSGLCGLLNVWVCLLDCLLVAIRGWGGTSGSKVGGMKMADGVSHQRPTQLDGTSGSHS